MTLLEWWEQSVHEFRHSKLFSGTVSFGVTVLSVFLAILLLLCVTFLLRQFFKRYAFINHAHKILIYLLTMSGVVMLILAGLLGLVLPLIPGIPLLLAALLLMRKYHRFAWVERLLRPFHRKEKVNKTQEGGKDRV
jgi:formate-dependent nitrite reductase membrane component NrfD